MSRQWNSPLLLLPLLMLCAAIAQATANEPPPAPQPAVARLSGVDFVGGAQHHFGASMLGKNRVNYVYAQSTGEHATMTATFELDKLPAAPVVLHLTARDNDAQAACAVLIELNGQAVFRGRNTFANDAWRTIRFELPEEALKTGVNSLKIVNLSEHGPLGNPPWFMVAEALIAPTDYVEQKTHSVELIQAMPAPKRDIGAAKIDITPSDPVLLSGYAGRRHLPTDTVSMPLWARAIAIGSDIEGPALLLAVDNLGVSAPAIRAVAAEIEKQHNIPRGRITVHSTHTHSAPMLTGTLENLLQRPLTEREQASIDAYTQELIKKLVKVADEALQARRPLVLSQAHGAVDFAVNRRGAATLVDRALPILVASDQRGEPLVIVANYACHCVASGSGLDINGDWAGAANAALEREFPRATAIITVGCGGDQNPTATGSVQQAVEQGEQVAAEAARLMALPLAPIAGPLQVQYAEIELPLAELPDRAEWERRAAELGITGHHATKNLQRLDRGEALPTSVDYPIQSWVFGDDLAMVFLANEVVVDYALALKQTYDPTRLWVSGYTNDVCGYVPSERILKEGGYEGGGAMVWYDLPGPFAPGIEKRILDEVARQLPEQFTERVNPALTGGTRPLSPEQSIATMQTHDDLRVELVAAEPLVIDPVAIDFGHDGKLWVVEMRDYPEGLDGSYLAGGVVKFLVDTDNDGRYDKATTFLEDIPFPTGITVWRAGVLICAAPDVLYAEDTTGDGRANVVRKVLSGFHTQNYQARVNSISLGLDNWMHGAAGIFGGRVTTPNGKVVDAANRDFRFLPDDGEVQAVSGRTQQGRARDDWGNWFGCENGTLLFHYPTTEHYHPRNPHVAPPNAQVAIAKSSKLLPRGQLVTWALSGPAGAPTAVCGLGIYRDTTLGDEYAGNAFLCEPVNQLVHRLRLVPHGETFSGQRSDDEQDREFLASTDNWFRPVQARGGPDGALYIVDMYRYMIEHPRFLSAEDRAQLDVRAGDTRGRIYRVVPRDWQPPKMPRPAERKTSELPNLLNSSNGSLRDMIHLELLWRNEPTVAAPLKSLVREAEFPQSRLQALCLLEGLGVLDSETVAAGLNDPHPAVRRHAVRLSEPLLAERPVLGERLAELATDEDPQVRLQVAYSLGAWNDPRSGHALSRMLQAAAREPYTRSAVLSSLNATNVASVLANLLEQSIENDGLPAGVNEVLLLAVQLGDAASLEPIIEQVLSSRDGEYAAWQWSLAPELTSALNRRNIMLPAAQQPAWTEMLAAAQAITADDALPLEKRIAAVQLLAQSSGDPPVLNRLAALFTPQTPTNLQQAAVATLGTFDTVEAATELLDAFGKLTPAVQRAALDAVVARQTMVSELLTRLESGAMPRGMIDAARRQALVNHPQPAIKARAAALFSAPSGKEIAALLATYAPIDPLAGNAERGQALFVQHCASCHQLNGVGHVVGPDLSALSDKSTSALLTSILDPNAAIDQRYATYTAVTLDGVVLTGLLTAESGNSITLKAQEGKEHTILRSELDGLHTAGKSMMPEGMAEHLPLDDMQHLLAFLVTDRAPAPSVVRMTQLLEGVAIGTKDEYRVIGQLFNESLAAGRRNNADELLAMLDFSLPQSDQPLRDWQAVVLGGGVINGVSQSGAWPGSRIAEILAQDADLRARWDAALLASVVMADDAQVPADTRYDALRMLALLPWEQAQPPLERYLGKDVAAALQMGAVSGACDADHPQAARLLIEALAGLSDGNQKLALQGLVRSRERAELLLASVEQQRLSIEQIAAVKQSLIDHADHDIRHKARQLFGVTPARSALPSRQVKVSAIAIGLGGGGGTGARARSHGKLVHPQQQAGGRTGPGSLPGAGYQNVP